MIANMKPEETELYERRFQNFLNGMREHAPNMAGKIRLTRPQKRLEWKLALREKTHTRSNDNPTA